MKVVIRIVVTLISGVAALYFAFWFAIPFAIPLTFLLHFPWISFLGSFLVAAVVAWYVWTYAASFQTSLAHSVLLGALVVGGIGFLAGFFGPQLFMPSGRTNPGPLFFGIITGPLGFILGAAGGAFHWYAREGRVGTSNWPKTGSD